MKEIRDAHDALDWLAQETSRRRSLAGDGAVPDPAVVVIDEEIAWHDHLSEPERKILEEAMSQGRSMRIHVGLISGARTVVEPHFDGEFWRLIFGVDQ